MKNTLIVLALFCLLSSESIFAQEWAPEGAEWYYDYDAFEVTGYIRIVSEGDTVINGQLCKVLAKTRFTYDYVTGNYETAFMGNEYTWSDTNKVYIYKYGQFYVLYDFSLQTGDSWTIPANYLGFCDSTGTMVVDSVGSIVVNNDSLRVVYCSPGESSHWFLGSVIIEKIGPLDSYMLPEMTNECGVPDLFEGGPLRCYYDEGFGWYSTGIAAECDYILGVGGRDAKGQLLQVYPNPATDWVAFAYTLPNKDSEAVIKITDATGKLIDVVAVNGQQGQKIWDTRHIKPGAYFYSFEAGTIIKSGKIIIVN
ncbi:MAG: T9SS type A sorting domain-containing protein [Chlorobi bacterium]|nr:T9SS type A sorting domain-containing protein [Chlorobiota bacterium]